jgi:hypothetical protein
MPADFTLRIKKTYGKTWANVTQADVITPAFLKKVGKVLVDSIVFEARKDLANQGGRPTPRGFPEGIPDDEKFFTSFRFEVVGTAVEIYSDWPWIEQITEGRRPYPMGWLTKQEGVSRVPMKGPAGTVLIKSTPASKATAWIHPGFRKHNFIRRGYERARRKIEDMLTGQVVDLLKKLPIT